MRVDVAVVAVAVLQRAQPARFVQRMRLNPVMIARPHAIVPFPSNGFSHLNQFPSEFPDSPAYCKILSA